MKITQAVIVLLSMILATQLIASTESMKVIYGEDNRKDVFESKEAAFVELARSTAAMVNGSDLKKSGEELQIAGMPLTSRGMCAKERFSHQVTAANCSGFLVSENVLVTAGHCIKSQSDCDSYKWVFDYKVDSAEQSNVTVPAGSVYTCKKIIDRSLDHMTKDDWAVIELDRPVTDRAPLNFRRTGQVETGAPLVVIGHPSGLPTKIADGAFVRSLADTYFIANLDTFGGNSGSAVFNVETSEVEGLLVRGENDYVYDYEGACMISNHCTDTGCRGEDVTYITNIPFLQNLP